MVKYLEYPEPGEQPEPLDFFGEERHVPLPEGTPSSVHTQDVRRRQQEFAPVKLHAAHNPKRNDDPCRRTSDDLYAVHLPEGSDAAEPRNDTTAEHTAPETPSDAVPDDAPLTGY